MADISTIEYRLKSLRSEIEEAGFSIVGGTGQLSKSAERRELESMPSLAVLQAELKRALDANKKPNPTTANKIFQVNAKIAKRQELEKKFDKSKFITKANALLTKLSVIENDFNAEMGMLKMANLERRGLAEEARKKEQERRVLANRSQELQLRRQQIRTNSDYQRLVDDAERYGQDVHRFSAEQEKTKSKIRQFQSRFEKVMAIPPQTLDRVQREMTLLKKSLEQARMGR